MAKKTVEFTADDAAAEVVAAFEKFLQVLAGTNGVTASQVEDEEEADEEVDVEVPVREEVESLGIKDLRALAADYGIEAKVKAEILEAFEEFYDEEDDLEEVDEDEDEDDDEEDESGEGAWTRDDLEEMDLKELRAVAKAEGHSASDYRGMDQDALIDLILGDEDEDEDDDEEDDEDVEELDEDALKAMSDKELTALAKELGVKVPTKVKSLKGAKLKKALVDLILDSGEEEE